MRKFRIAIDARVWKIETGGIARYTQALVRELLKLDTTNEYTLIVNKADAKQLGIKAPNLKVLKVDVPQYSLTEQRELLHILNQEQFDLVHFTNFNHPIRYKGNFICTVHDLIMHMFPSGAQTKSLVRKIAYRLIMRDTRRAAKILVPSNATASDCRLLLGMKDSRMSVIPLGAPIHPVVSPDESAKTLAKFGITGNFLLFVSRWERYKGLDTLLESFAILRAEFPDLQLVICGKPVATSPDVADLVSVAKAGGLKVITPGFVTDTELSTLYQTASIYVHPSRYEGFGLMILEAFAAGVPVVTSTASCLPEVAGEAALLANPNDSTELAEKISDILSNPELAATLRELGLARAAEYTWAKTAAATHDAYLQTLTH
jgi:glycosyltransferase involved in cell wall biosynthesis